MLAPVLLALAAPAVATTIYDNGAPVNFSGNETTAWVQAEDFGFATSTTVGGAGIYVAGIPTIASYDGNLQYYIFANNGGTPGSILASGSVTPTAVDMGLPTPFGSSIYLLSFNFSSAFTAVGGTGYYLGIHASVAGDLNRDEVYWLGAASNATHTGVESNNGTFTNWSGNVNEHAFFLTDGASVPEPASWALMIGGFALTGVAMRQRQAALAA
ncbi:PEPxxWA-CTERM sorting domain-containing protein [Sphingosinicellaceae bacterium]|nr:PEPxxWA-CTERM sorting domain-containing protein [Sphingosinicellaceae bacterium]